MLSRNRIQTLNFHIVDNKIDRFVTLKKTLLIFNNWLATEMWTHNYTGLECFNLTDTIYLIYSIIRVLCRWLNCHNTTVYF